MATEIWLTVTGEQKDSDGRSDRNAVRCRALYEKRGEEHIFTYRETDPESGAVTDSEMLFMQDVRPCEDKDEARKVLAELIGPDTAFLFKASRGMALEELCSFVRESCS